MAQVDDYYQKSAQEYFQQTFLVDMEPLRARFLAHVPKNGRILDAGCGSGRDAKAFLEHGYQVSAFDAVPALAHLASTYINQPVEVLLFQELAYEKKFDGIWACASLLHVPQNELPDVFRRLHRALKPSGVLYASFKYGSGEVGRNGRRFTDMDESGLTILLEQVKGFGEIETWVSEDRRPDRDDEHWLNTLLRVEEGAWRSV